MFIVLGIYNYGLVMSNHVLFLPKIVHQCWLDERLNPWWLDWKLNWYVFSILFLVFIHFPDNLEKSFWFKEHLEYKTLFFPHRLKPSSSAKSTYDYHNLIMSEFWYRITTLLPTPTLTLSHTPLGTTTYTTDSKTNLRLHLHPCQHYLLTLQQH